MDYDFEKVCRAGLKTATHTVIRHTQAAIPGRLHLEQACFRLTGRWNYYRLFHCCKGSTRISNGGGSLVTVLLVKMPAVSV